GELPGTRTLDPRAATKLTRGNAVAEASACLALEASSAERPIVRKAAGASKRRARTGPTLSRSAAGQHAVELRDELVLVEHARPEPSAVLPAIGQVDLRDRLRQEPEPAHDLG